MVLSCVALAAIFAGCSNNNNGSGGSSDTSVTVAGQCLVGQIVDNYGNCYNVSPNCPAANTGWNPATNSCVAGTYVTPNYYAGGNQTLDFENQFNNVNTTVLGSLISDYNNGCGVTWILGGPNYSSLANESYIGIYVNSVGSTQALITIGIGAIAPDDPNNPPAEVMYFNAQVYVINANNATSGIELQASGTAGSCSWNAVGNNGLVVTVNSQNFSSTYMDAVVSYRGSVLGHSRVYSY
jgi:hypothetical protein